MGQIPHASMQWWYTISQGSSLVLVFWPSQDVLAALMGRFKCGGWVVFFPVCVTSSRENRDKAVLQAKRCPDSWRTGSVSLCAPEKDETQPAGRTHQLRRQRTAHQEPEAHRYFLFDPRAFHKSPFGGRHGRHQSWVCLLPPAFGFRVQVSFRLSRLGTVAAERARSHLAVLICCQSLVLRCLTCVGMFTPSPHRGASFLDTAEDTMNGGRGESNGDSFAEWMQNIHSNRPKLCDLASFGGVFYGRLPPCQHRCCFCMM